jgi:signal transduction histidine kinase
MVRKRISIKWKIFAYLLGFCALLLIILWVFQTVLLDAFYRNIKISEIRRNAVRISEYLDDNALLFDQIHQISQSSECYIEIISEQGNALMSAGDLRNRIPPDEKMNLLIQARTSDGEVTVFFPDRSFAEGVSFGGPDAMEPQFRSIIYVKNIKGLGAIFINSMISPVNATVTTLRWQLVFITGIMLLLSVLLAVIIAKKVSKPIENLNHSAKALSKGRYDVTFSDSGYREIVELSDTLNIAAAELNKVEALRRELMANISHDLRTPLSLIYGYAEMMHDFPGEITKEQTLTIMEETRRLSTLVSDVLQISRLESGNEELNLSEFEFTASLQAAAERLGELLKNEGYRLLFSYDKKIKLRADEVKIMQVFYNLLINAVHYTGTDKTVAIRQTADKDSVKIEVSDTGAGISEESLPYIWDRYYKEHKNHKRAVTGTGLGLSIVKKLIELHGGSCGAHSEPGAGSTFWFSLPVN